MRSARAAGIRARVARTGAAFALSIYVAGCHDSTAGAGTVVPAAVVKPGLPVFVSSSQHRTQIVVVDPATNDRRPLFSDATLPLGLELSPSQPVIASNRIFAYAGRRVPPATLQYDDRAKRSRPRGFSIVELSLDQSNNYRQILEPLGDTVVHSLFVSPRGDKIGYLAGRHGAEPTRPGMPPLVAFIHHTSDGRLLSSIVLDHACPGCDVASIGWYGEGRLYVSSEMGDEHLADPAAAAKLGIYVADEVDGRLARLPASVMKFPSKPQLRQGDFPPVAVGTLPTGELLVWERIFPHCAPVFLYAVDPTHGIRREFRLNADCAFSPVLFPPGHWLLFRQTAPGKSVHHWAKDLDTLAEKIVVRGDTNGLRAIGWLLQ